MKKDQEKLQVSFSYEEDLLRGGEVTYAIQDVDLDGARYSINKYPFNSVPLIEFSRSGSNSFGISSGVVVGPHTILTASHSMFPGGKRADDWDIFMRYSDNHFPNPGSSEALPGRSKIHYFNVGQDGTLSRHESQWDYAVINTSHKFSSWFGMMTEFSGGKVHMTGYPGKLNGLQQDVKGRVDRHSQHDVLDYENFRSSPGNSGGPIWVDKDPGRGIEPYVVGIVSTTDWATLLSNSVFKQIKKWVKQDGYSLGGRIIDERSKRHADDFLDDAPRKSSREDRADILDLRHAKANDDDRGTGIDLDLLMGQPDTASVLAGF